MPAILVALLGGLGAEILFFGPISTLGSFAAVLLYVLMCGVVIAAGHVNRRTLKALQATRSVLLDARASLEDQVRARTAELARTNRGLRDLSRRLLQVQDEERRRIARNLHDSTGQVLTALLMSLSSLRKQASKTSPRISAALAENEALVKDLADELRTLSHLLHPPLLDEIGLESALRWYAEGFEGRSRIRTRVEMSAETGRLAPEMETALFRVVQEGLTNIHRHSASLSATIRCIGSTTASPWRSRTRDAVFRRNGWRRSDRVRWQGLVCAGCGDESRSSGARSRSRPTEPALGAAVGPGFSGCLYCKKPNLRNEPPALKGLGTTAKSAIPSG